MRNGVGLGVVAVALLLALVCEAGLAQMGPRYVIDAAAGADVGGPARGSVQLAGKGLALIRFRGLRVLAVGADADAYSAESVRDWPAADLVLVTPANVGRYDGLAPLAALRRLPVILVEPSDSATVPPLPASDDGPRYYPMQTWDALHLRKGRSQDKTWLRVTAVPGRPGTAHVAGFVLEMGNRQTSYRLYVSCEALGADDIDGLSRRLPGADLALLPARDGPMLLPLRRVQTGEPSALTTAGYPFSAIRR
ncbi:hypothetical protein JOD97_006379 [Duganella sp. 1411]|uniref:hypothetical protein n=1 Tax=Duganella sp. 1411 TaxID=2806572 RepID=UPI001AE1DD3B|nr:hypothetical protein [Duganella sp. 1411]MBP1208288.1 hypothetical protein [Duganella sp. 1411]